MNLPVELWNLIFEKSGPSMSRIFRMVCKQWKNIIDERQRTTPLVNIPVHTVVVTEHKPTPQQIHFNLHVPTDSSITKTIEQLPLIGMWRSSGFASENKYPAMMMITEEQTNLSVFYQNADFSGGAPPELNDFQSFEEFQESVMKVIKEEENEEKENGDQIEIKLQRYFAANNY